MAETKRTLAAILALLADNTSGAISPEDMRDAIISVFATYGELRTIGNSGGTPQTIGTSYAKVAQWTSSIANGVTADHATNRRVTVPLDGIYRVTATILFTGTVSVDYVIDVQKNAGGSQEAALGTRIYFDASTTNGTACISGLVSLSASDYLELWVKASAGGSSFLLVEGSLSIEKIG